MAESAGEPVELEVGSRVVRLTSPDRVYFPLKGWTKLDLVNYYLSVGDGIVRALREFQGWNSTVAICTAQITAASSVTHNSSAVRPNRGK